MKTIEYMCSTYEVPDWVNWVATDRDAEIYGYRDEPYINDKTHNWNIKNCCDDNVIIYSDAWNQYCPNWRDSLVQVGEVEQDVCPEVVV